MCQLSLIPQAVVGHFPTLSILGNRLSIKAPSALHDHLAFSSYGVFVLFIGKYGTFLIDYIICKNFGRFISGTFLSHFGQISDTAPKQS